MFNMLYEKYVTEYVESFVNSKTDCSENLRLLIETELIKNIIDLK